MLGADPHPFVSHNRTVLKKAAILISPTVIGRPFHTFFGAEQRMARGIVFNFPQPDLSEGRKLSVKKNVILGYTSKCLISDMH